MKNRDNVGVIRINPKMVGLIEEIAEATKLPKGKVATTLLEYALKNMTLVERPVYDIQFKEE